jgi:uncharacterized protein (TIGR02217 family)
MTIFINELLDVDIEAGAKARTRFSTDIVPTDGGYEVRNSRWNYPLMSFEFNLSPGYREDDAALEAFINMFMAAGGAFATFRFHWWRDLPVVGQQIGVGDGSTTEFQLYRTYTRGGVTRRRKITRPVEGTLTVYSNGVPVAVGIDWDTGVVIYGAAPPVATVITADFEHDLPVRFADDELEIIGITDTLDQPVSIVLNEVRE